MENLSASMSIDFDTTEDYLKSEEDISNPRNASDSSKIIFPLRGEIINFQEANHNKTDPKNSSKYTLLVFQVLVTLKDKKKQNFFVYCRDGNPTSFKTLTKYQSIEVRKGFCIENGIMATYKDIKIF